MTVIQIEGKIGDVSSTKTSETSPGCHSIFMIREIREEHMVEALSLTPPSTVPSRASSSTPTLRNDAGFDNATEVGPTYDYNQYPEVDPIIFYDWKDGDVGATFDIDGNLHLVKVIGVDPIAVMLPDENQTMWFGLSPDDLRRLRPPVQEPNIQEPNTRQTAPLNATGSSGGLLLTREVEDNTPVSFCDSVPENSQQQVQPSEPSHQFYPFVDQRWRYSYSI